MLEQLRKHARLTKQSNSAIVRQALSEFFDPPKFAMSAGDRALIDAALRDCLDHFRRLSYILPASEHQEAMKRSFDALVLTLDRLVAP